MKWAKSRLWGTDQPAQKAQIPSRQGPASASDCRCCSRQSHAPASLPSHRQPPPASSLMSQVPFCAPLSQLAPRPAVGSFSNSSHALVLVRLEACRRKAPCPIHPGRPHGAHQNPPHNIVCVQKALRPRWSIMGSKGRLFSLLFDFITSTFFQFWKTKI